MAPFSSQCLTLLAMCVFLTRVQTSVISDHFKTRVLDEKVSGQSVNQDLETEDDMITELNGGALTDFFHSYSVLEDDSEDVSEGDEESDLINVQEFLNLTDHGLASPRSISSRFQVNAGNPIVEEYVKMSVEDSDHSHEHHSGDFVSDLELSKVIAPSQADLKLVKESSQPVSLPSPPAFPPSLESLSKTDSNPPPAEYVPSPVVEPAPEPSSPESSTPEPSTSSSLTELSTSEPLTLELSSPKPSTSQPSSLSSTPEPSSTAPAMDVDDSDDSLDNLFMELENLNILSDALEALNRGPQVAEDRNDVVDDGYGDDEADDIFTDLFNWFG